MKKKRIFAGIAAIVMVSGMTACGSSEEADTADETTSATTTTGVTVAVNTEALKEEEEDALSDVMSKLRDVELENKEIKWLAHYDINPNTNGASKKVEIEMFEKKYGGSIKWYPTTWDNRYTDLSTNILGGEGIDFFPSDANNLPKGIVNGMFVPVDDYIDLDSDIWSETKNAMELLNFNGKHYEFVTGVTAEQVTIYNTQTIEENGFEDPWELYKKGEWNWDTFEQMLIDFVDVDNDCHGLDGWYNEKALFLSAGVPMVQSVDGNLVCNINDPTVERAMNFQYDLYNNGLVLPLEQYDWSIQPQMMGEGKELFYFCGSWGFEGAPETWETKIPPENMAIAPVPSPAGSDPYQSAVLNGFVLCKGAQNPLGVALFAECSILAGTDENAVAISDRKLRDDSGWSDELIERNKEINALAKEYPVLDLAAGCSADIASLTTDGGATIGTRAAFHGVDWATNRESTADVLLMLVDEVNEQIKES